MTEEEASRKEGTIPREKSQIRRDVEKALARQGLALESRISVTNLDSHETQYFDDYSKAMEFIKGRKGRWYLNTPGIKYVGKSEERSGNRR
jgi:hypothetical protein